MPDSLKTHAKILRLVLLLSFFPLVRGCNDVNGLCETTGVPVPWKVSVSYPAEDNSVSLALLALNAIVLYGLILVTLSKSARNGTTLIGWRFFVLVIPLFLISYFGGLFLFFPFIVVCLPLLIVLSMLGAGDALAADLAGRLLLFGALAICFRIAQRSEEPPPYHLEADPPNESERDGEPGRDNESGRRVEPETDEDRPSIPITRAYGVIHHMTANHYTGCLLGLALGDAFGAPHEGGPVERLLWRLIGTTGDGKHRWTDDTQMTLDVAESLLENDGLDQDDLARRFAQSYRWSRGYGPAAAKLLRRIAQGEDWREVNRAVYAEGSFGNGAAMRAAAVGLFYATRPGELKSAAHRSAEITHAHPRALDGAALLAEATARAVRGESGPDLLEAAATVCAEDLFKARLVLAHSWLRDRRLVEPAEVGADLGNGIAAVDSCVTAVYLGLRFANSPMEDLLDFTAALRGDTDTIGAMAGAIWGAIRGVEDLPEDLLEQLEERERIEGVGRGVFEWVSSHAGSDRNI